MSSAPLVRTWGAVAGPHQLVLAKEVPQEVPHRRTIVVAALKLVELRATDGGAQGPAVFDGDQVVRRSVHDQKRPTVIPERMQVVEWIAHQP